MKKLLLVPVICLSFAHTYAQEHESAAPQPTHQHVITDLDAFAREWAHAAVNDLCQEELELLGTFLYYDVAMSYYELALRNSLLDLQRGSQILAFKIMNQENPEESARLCAQLNALIEHLEKELAPSRNYFLAVWQLCDKEICECSYTTLPLAIQNLKQLGQRALNNWASTNKQEIEELLYKNSQKLDEALQKIHFCKNSLQALAEGEFPLDETAEFIDIQTIHNSLGVAHIAYEALFNASLATDEVMGISFGMIGLNAAIFSSLYQAFYNELEQKNLVPMPIVINEQGLIPTELRTQVLPKFSFNNEVAA